MKTMIQNLLAAVCSAAMFSCGEGTEERLNRSDSVYSGSDQQLNRAGAVYGSLRQTGQASTLYGRPIDSPPVITRSEYDRIENDMPYGQVLQIVGEQPDIERESVNPVSAMVTNWAEWYNGDGSYAKLQFFEGKLIRKEQSNL